MTAIVTPPPTLLQVLVLGVYWCQDLRAEEQGFSLLYRPADGDAVAMTLLADERGVNDAPLYLGDRIELRRVGHRRHAITRNLTRVRGAEAMRVDWDAIWASAQGVAPAQLSDTLRAWLEEVGPSEELAALDRPSPDELRDQFYARKYPDVHAWLQRRNPQTVAIDPDDDDLPPVDWPEQKDNGGW